VEEGRRAEFTTFSKSRDPRPFHDLRIKLGVDTHRIVNLEYGSYLRFRRVPIGKNTLLT
jgi:hypothetical protein